MVQKEVGSLMKTLGKEATVLQSPFSTGMNHGAKQSSHEADVKTALFHTLSKGIVLCKVL